MVEPTTLTMPRVRAPAALRFAHRRQRVGGLAGLRDHDAERAVVDDGVPVPELRRVLHLDRDPRQLLDHVLANQRGMPARAARRDDDVVDRQQVFVGQVRARELRGRWIEQEPARERARDRLGLLEDLLEHEVRVPATFHLRQVPIDLADFPVLCQRIEAHDPIAVAIEDREVAVLEIHDFARMREDGRRVARHVVLALAQPHEQRAALAGRHDLVGVAARDRGDPVRALDLAQRLDHGILQRSVERRFDQMHQHLGVRLRGEDMAEVLQLTAQRAGVLDDAVVHDGELVLLVHVRMRVHLVGRTVRRPPGVADPERPRDRTGRQQ